MWVGILEALIKFLGLLQSYLLRRSVVKQQQKAQEVANTPKTDDEWTIASKRGDL